MGILLLLAAMLAAAAPSSAHAGGARYHVLLLLTQSPANDEANEVATTVTRVLAEADVPVTISVEHLDADRFDGEQSAQAMRALMTIKYGAEPINVVMTCGNHALNFALERRAELFPQASVVFFAATDMTLVQAHPERVTGYPDALAPDRALELVQHLTPRVRTIGIVAGTSEPDRIALEAVKRVEGRYASRFRFVELTNHTVTELKRAVAQLPPDSAVLYAGFEQDREGETIPLAEGLHLVKDATVAPVYALRASQVQAGAMAGVVSSRRDQSRKAATLVIKVLQGEPFPSQAVQPALPVRTVVNYPELRHADVDPDRIPEQATVLAKPPTLIQDHPKLVVGAGATVGGLAIAVVSLLAFSVQRKRQHQQTRVREQFVKSVLDSLPACIFLQNEADQLVLVNDRTAELFRLGAETITGLTPDQLAEMQPAVVATGLFGPPTGTSSDKQQPVEVVVTSHHDQPRYFQVARVALARGGITRLLSVAVDVTKRRHTEAALRESEARYRSLFQDSPVALCEVDVAPVKACYDRWLAAGHEAGPDTLAKCVPLAKVVGVNRAALEVFQAKSADDVNAFVDRVWDDASRQTALRAWQQLFSGTSVAEAEITYRMPDGQPLTTMVRWHALPGASPKHMHMLVSHIDLTLMKRSEEERRQFEARMQQVQKLESLGVLAGGIAHDFNNLLVAILGNAELALQELDEKEAVRTSLEAIRKASLRAAELTKQMLAYTGKATIVVHPVHLNELVRNMTQLLGVSVSKRVKLRYELCSKVGPVEADPSQLRQVLINLVTNASEAIGDTDGTITIRTRMQEVEVSELASPYVHETLAPGPYALLEVQDTGAGMNDITKARLFEPFFSTKFMGRGLGLSAVIGIVRGHRGSIQVTSTPGHGTTMRVLLPILRQAKPQNDPNETPAPVRSSPQATVMVVDDDPMVRAVARRILERAGYRVVQADDGAEAVQRFSEQGSEIDAVLLDWTMPRMDGEQALLELRAIRGDVKVILTSGYAEEEMAQRFADRALNGYVQKPFEAATLLSKVQMVLG